MTKTANAIRKFIRKNKMKKIDFCILTGIHRWTLHKYLNGGNMRPFIARRIEKNTDGALKLNDLIDID